MAYECLRIMSYLPLFGWNSIKARAHESAALLSLNEYHQASQVQSLHPSTEWFDEVTVYIHAL